MLAGTFATTTIIKYAFVNNFSPLNLVPSLDLSTLLNRAI